MVFDRLKIERGIQFDIDTRAVYALLGYKKDRTKLPQQMIDLVDSSFQEARELITPVGVYIIRRIEKKANPITLQGSRLELRGNSARNLLKNSFAVIFLAVTIGLGLETRINLYTEEKQFEKTLVLDAIGSEAAEAAADAFSPFIELARDIGEAGQEAGGLATTRARDGVGVVELSPTPWRWLVDRIDELPFDYARLKIARP